MVCNFPSAPNLFTPEKCRQKSLIMRWNNHAGFNVISCGEIVVGSCEICGKLQNIQAFYAILCEEICAKIAQLYVAFLKIIKIMTPAAPFGWLCGKLYDCINTFCSGGFSSWTQLEKNAPLRLEYGSWGWTSREMNGSPIINKWSFLRLCQDVYHWQIMDGNLTQNIHKYFPLICEYFDTVLMFPLISDYLDTCSAD